MTLPPLANLFAVHDDDPLSLAAIAADLQAGGEFAEVWRPAAGWVAAAAPLPRGEPDDRSVRAAGLAFAEGRDVVGKEFGAMGELVDGAPERLATLRGDFGFIRFRPHGGATVVRSCGGLVPFYLLSHPSQRTAVATRLGDFVRYLPNEPQLDALSNAIWTMGHIFFPDGRTFLRGVTILDRGSFARLEPARPIATGRYWDPRPERLPRPTPARAREHADRLRVLLIDKLTRDLDSEGGNLLTLSGGVDSSSLGALAAGVVGRKVWTWSLLPEPEDRFQSQMSYIAPLARRFGFERTWTVRLGKETRLELLRAAPRVVFHVMHPALCALPGILQEAPVRVLFGGEFADEVCGSVFTLPDWVRDTSLVALIRGLGTLPTGPRDVLRWAKRRLLGLAGRVRLPHPDQLPEFVRVDIREEYQRWRKRRRQTAAGDRRPRRYLELRAEFDGFIAMNWEAASALGIRRSFPFFNREVLELAFECHPAELIGPGTKKLLRAALRNYVPAHNLQRPDKGVWGSYLDGVRLPWSAPLPAPLDSIVRPEWYPRPPASVGYLEAAGLTQLVAFVDSLQARRRSRGLRAAQMQRTFSGSGMSESLPQREEAR
jgi:asparagine synthase (glutamine-hydrolysing)